ncbi:Nucleoporin NUP88/NUP82 [Gracilaria domingensis]|nr:Nucleoporin NUP88/NUP82 [Gracilaria domingensis]
MRSQSVPLDQQTPADAAPHTLPSLSPTHAAVVSNDQMHMIPLTARAMSRRTSLPFSPLYEVVSGPYTALVASTELAVLHQHSGVCYSVATALFERRPALRILHVQWLPSAPAFLMLLTSDYCLRVFDAISAEAAEFERQRIHVVTAGAPPVSFVCGSGLGWHGLSVYVLAEDGSVYVAAPIAPIGTSISIAEFEKLRRAAKSALSQNATDTPISPGTSRRLSFGDFQMPWALRQARLQMLFLDTVFEKNGNQMLAVREFKPAPLLFQGPLHVQKELLDERYTQLVQITATKQPILLRVSERGNVCVLLAMERVDANWFLSSQPAGEGLMLASKEYASCAQSVAPAFLCFERISFDSPVSITPVASHADTFFFSTTTAVYSLTFSFLSLLEDALALERCPTSTLRELFTVHNPDGSSPARIRAIMSHYVRGDGPVAIVLLNDGTFHVTDPLRWHSLQVDLPTLLPDRPFSESQQNLRAYAFRETAENVVHSLRHVESLRDQYGRLADGTLGKVSSIKSFASTLTYLEKRVEVLTGNSQQPGIGDSLGNIASLLLEWTHEIGERSESNASDIEKLQTVLIDADRSEQELRLKLNRVTESIESLKGRVKTVFEGLEAGSAQLSKLELERLAVLKQKKQRLSAFRTRIAELSAAMQSRNQQLVSRPSEGGDQSTLFSRNIGAGSWRGSSRRREPAHGQKRVELGRRELHQIKIALEKHSDQISQAMELSSSLWKRLSVIT